MYPRTNYEMSQEDLDAILDACRPTPVLFGTGGINMSGDQQVNANAAWARLGERMGFDPMTVRPLEDVRNMRLFSAVPNETEAMRDERLAREAIEKRERDLADLDSQIAELQRKRAVLTES